MSETLHARLSAIDSVADADERLSGLFTTHYDRLYRLARRLCASRDDALDLLQETFLRAAQRPNGVPVGEENEAAWLVRVLTNIRRDQWRKASVRKRYSADLRPPAPVNQEAGLTTRLLIWQALDTLPPRRRAVVVLHELEGMPMPAVASLLGMNPITCRWHLSRARRTLAHRLAPQIGDKK